MRHFFTPLAIAALPHGMAVGPLEGALVAGAGATRRLTPSEPRALPGAVHVPVITLRADAHLHPAAAAVVEPIGRRLLEQLQDPPPRATGQPRGGRA